MIALEIAAAVLAVIGAFSLIRAVGEWLLTPRGITAAVLVACREDIRNLDILLRVADRHSLRTRRQPPVVLVDRALLRPTGRSCPGCEACGLLLPDAAAQALLASRGVRWFPADLTGGRQEDAGCGEKDA